MFVHLLPRMVTSQCPALPKHLITPLFSSPPQIPIISSASHTGPTDLHLFTCHAINHSCWICCTLKMVAASSCAIPEMQTKSHITSQTTWILTTLLWKPLFLQNLTKISGVSWAASYENGTKLKQATTFLFLKELLWADKTDIHARKFKIFIYKHIFICIITTLRLHMDGWGHLGWCSHGNLPKALASKGY